MQTTTWIIEDNETGWDYRRLFTPYTAGASSVVITDPFLLLPHQQDNLRSLVSMLLCDTLVRGIHVVTKPGTVSYLADVNESLCQLSQEVADQGARLTWNWVVNLHDRSVEFDNGWLLVVDRGLDLFARPSWGWASLGGADRRLRQCKRCRVTACRPEGDRHAV